MTAMPINLELDAPVTRAQAAAAPIRDDLDGMCTCEPDRGGYKTFTLVATQGTGSFEPREIYRHAPCGALANIPWT